MTATIAGGGGGSGDGDGVVDQRQLKVFTSIQIFQYSRMQCHGTLANQTVTDHRHEIHIQQQQQQQQASTASTHTNKRERKAATFPCSVKSATGAHRPKPSRGVAQQQKESEKWKRSKEEREQYRRKKNLSHTADGESATRLAGRRQAGTCQCNICL